MARIISIDLGAYAVKVSVRTGTGADDTVALEASQRVPADVGVLPSIDERLAALDEILREHPDLKQGSHTTVVTWPGDLATVHRLELPFGDDAQLAQTLPFAVESEVPFDLDSMAMAWRRADDGHVLVTLARRADLSGMLDGLAERGLDPRRVLPEGESLAAWAQGGDDKVYAVIDVGHSKTTLVVARAGRALMSRAVSLGGRTFAGAIAASLGCSPSEGEALLRGVPDEDDLRIADLDLSGPSDSSTEERTLETTSPRLDIMPAKAVEALHASMGLLLAEIRSSLVHAEDELGIGIDEVILTGGASRARDFATFLHNDLGVPVVRAREYGVEVPDALASVRGATACIALGESGMTDLRVGDLAWRGGMDATRLVFRYGGAMVGFFMAAVVLMFAFQYYKLTGEQADVEARTRALVLEAVPDLPEDLSASGAVELLSSSLDDANMQASFLGDANSAPPTVDLLSKITDNFPKPDDVTVQVDLLDITPNAIQIEGSTDGFAQVDKIDEGLTKSGLFPAVETSPGNKDAGGKLGFKISIQRVEVAEDGDTDVPPAGEEG